MKLLGKFRFCFSHQIFLILGCIFGIALSLIFTSLLEETCFGIHDVPNFDGYTQNIEVDEYEPVLNLNGKAKKVNEKFPLSRPRYYSSELGIKEKLFIGILSTPGTILSLGSALNKTLSKHANKVLFFLEGTDIDGLNLDVISVVTFTDARELLAPFFMLQHIADSYIHDYDFFFFAKDTTHVRGKKLFDFVNQISITQKVHIGESVSVDSLYCNLDAGVLLSSAVLTKTVQDLDWCIQHTFSESSSDNFGRCILHGADMPCGSSVQGQFFLSHHASKSENLETSIQKSSWVKDLKHVLTVYSVTTEDEHYLIHHYFCQQELSDNHHELQKYQEMIINMSGKLPINTSDINWPVGLEPTFKPRGRFDVLSWIYFNATHNFLENEISVLSEIQGLNKIEIEDLLKSVVHWVKTRYNDKYIYQRLTNGYKRFDPIRGTEYTLDLVFLEDATGIEILKRIVAVRPLNEVEIVPVPFVTEHTRVIFLIIIKASDRDDAVQFLEDYEKSCIEKQESTVLLIVFLYGPQDPGKGEQEDVFLRVKELITSLTNKHRSLGAKIAWLSVKTLDKMPPYFAIVDLVSRKLSADSLILICHVGMEIHSEYINRARMNTILKTQVFFPIPFSQYHLALSYKHITPPGNVEVKKDFGYFDTSSFDHASFYLSDYLIVRKQFESKIPLIKADKDLRNEVLYTTNDDLFDMFLQSKLHVMRAVEPDLRIRYKLNACDQELGAITYQECIQNRAKKLGTKSQMAAAILSHAEDEDTKNDLQFEGVL